MPPARPIGHSLTPLLHTSRRIGHLTDPNQPPRKMACRRAGTPPSAVVTWCPRRWSPARLATAGCVCRSFPVKDRVHADERRGPR